MKNINLEYLYLDLDTCDRCLGSESVLEDAISELEKQYPSVNFKLKKVHIDSLQKAVECKFVSSPTIRINGQDLPVTLEESNCSSCSDISGTSTDCRAWSYNGKKYNTAPKLMLVEVISNILDEKTEPRKQTETYQTPENIIDFFESKAGSKSHTDSFCCS